MFFLFTHELGTFLRVLMDSSQGADAFGYLRVGLRRCLRLFFSCAPFWCVHRWLLITLHPLFSGAQSGAQAVGGGCGGEEAEPHS